MVLAKRAAYRGIIRDDWLTFGALQVLPVAEGFQKAPDSLDHIWVYGRDFVKGPVAVKGEEITKLFVDPFFRERGLARSSLPLLRRIEAGDFCGLWRKTGRPSGSIKSTGLY